MKKACLILLVNLIFSSGAFSQNNCFIATENGKFVAKEGSCTIRHSPCSSFKIAISLMGYNEGILIDETHPKYPFKPGYTDTLVSWRQPQNPHTWIQTSCIWYSQLITQKLGIKKFQQYVDKFQYGNQDLSGDPGKNNGLTHAWLSSSLQISPEEQVVFLEKLLDAKLPVSTKATDWTRRILFIETLPNGWNLYGKTGSGTQPHLKNKDDYQMGWFVGWAQKKDRTLVFAQYIEDTKRINAPAGLRAKEMVKEKLKTIN